jgi:hypothetical protein
MRIDIARHRKLFAEQAVVDGISQLQGLDQGNELVVR